MINEWNPVESLPKKTRKRQSWQKLLFSRALVTVSSDHLCLEEGGRGLGDHSLLKDFINTFQKHWKPTSYFYNKRHIWIMYVCLVVQSCPTFCDPMGLCPRGFSRQKYWSGLPYPPPGDLPNPEIEPRSPAIAGRFFSIWATREAQVMCGSAL